MRIAFVEIQNFRGIRQLAWAPAPRVNCLIGPGDSTKTTILDAIELALSPRYNWAVDDSDFYNLDFMTAIKITVTIVELPPEFKSDDRYGLHLRGWNEQDSRVEDEPGGGLTEALSIRVSVDESLEARWSLYNERIGETEDPPSVRFKDSKQFATTRLGPYAERHLGWGRQSVLSRLGGVAEKLTLQLAEASRAARKSFRSDNRNVFRETVERAEVVGRKFSVPVRDKYVAELDVQGVNITTGGIALHDDNLPLRRLGTGSSRLIVSALQHDAGLSHVALIDEIEHGLEPHRIARLLQFLKSPADSANPALLPQILMTTHSPVVIRELNAGDIFAVRSEAGETKVVPVAACVDDFDTAQRHLRRTPEAFLARRVAIGEGRTEQGLLRGLDAWWSAHGKESFALLGVIAIDGSGQPNAPMFAEHLLDLGYGALALLDSDEPPDAATIARVRRKGGTISIWPETCSTEERIFIDVPWKTVVVLIRFAEECVGADSVLANINNACKKDGIGEIADLTLPGSLDNPTFRRAIGRAAKHKNSSWFKDISRGERVAEIIAPDLDAIKGTPLAISIAEIRKWVDG